MNLDQTPLPHYPGPRPFATIAGPLFHPYSSPIHFHCTAPRGIGRAHPLDSPPCATTPARARNPGARPCRSSNETPDRPVQQRHPHLPIAGGRRGPGMTAPYPQFPVPIERWREPFPSTVALAGPGPFARVALSAQVELMLPAVLVVAR